MLYFKAVREKDKKDKKDSEWGHPASSRIDSTKHLPDFLGEEGREITTP